MTRRRYSKKYRPARARHETQAIKKDKKISEHFERYIKKPTSSLKAQRLKDESLINELSKDVKLLEESQNRANSISYQQRKIESDLGRIRHMRESTTKNLQRIIDYERKSVLSKFFTRRPSGSKAWFSKDIFSFIQTERELKQAQKQLAEESQSLRLHSAGMGYSPSEIGKLVKSKSTKINNAKLRLIALEKAIEFLREQESTVEAIRKSSESKTAAYKAYKAAYFSKSRSLAMEVKGALNVQLSIFENCPYCGEDIGTEPHADHIYPVSKGGLSTERNMILVCKDCNLAKSNYTLREFIERQRLNRQFIESNLRRLKKDF